MKSTVPEQLSLIQDMVGKAGTVVQETGGDAVIFLGQPTDPIPRALIQDRDLGAWARLIWCYFRQLSDSPAATGAAGDYDSIRKTLGIGSRGTVSDALQALRLTRWVTCLSVLDRSGRSVYTPNVYVLHNSPISFSLALELDPAYAEYIDRALNSPGVGIRELARRMLDGAMADDPSDPGLELRRRAGSAAAGNSALWYQYQRAPEPEQTELEAAAECREESRQRQEEAKAELDLHEDILKIRNPGVARIVEMKLRDLPADLRQPYLDEMAVKVLEGESGKGRQVNNPIAYLGWLVNEHKAGNVAIDGRGTRLKEMLAEMDDRERRDRVKARQAEQADLLEELKSEFSWISQNLERKAWEGKELLEFTERKEQLEKEIKDLIEWIKAA
ncbi:MAG: hypothetical protein OXF20_16640 [Gammaproteobacteria bacterium]|nr:hypothetical protein [Gammaproteobacteria bacterium]